MRTFTDVTEEAFSVCLLAFCVVFWSNISPKFFIHFCKTLKPIKFIRNLNGLLAVICVQKLLID